MTAGKIKKARLVSISHLHYRAIRVCRAQCFDVQTLVFTAAVFLSAFLLFLIQPMAARALLPAVGGAPAVWNTCMLFFQAVLLAGYGYAHVVSRMRKLRLQLWVHAGVATLALLGTWLLPFAAKTGSPTPGSSPIPWVLIALAQAVGPSFFVLSVTSPLLQRWFTYTGHPRAHDPYFLYAAGNVGSLLSLFGYPLVFELLAPLSVQRSLWRFGYALFFVLLIYVVIRMTRLGEVGRSDVQPDLKVKSAAPPMSQRLIWMGLAFVPSSLTLGVTTFLTSDLGAIPFLWTVPLGLYLVTFVIAFSPRLSFPSRKLVPAVAGLALFAAVTSGHPPEVVPVWLSLGLHLGAFFVVALVFHGRLAERRPQAEHLTAFYFWISVGGVLGGLFNAVIAPVLFPWSIEYPLVLGIACLTRLPTGPHVATFWRSQLFRAAAFAAIGIAILWISRTIIADRALGSSYGWFNVPLLLLAVVSLRWPSGLAVMVVLLPLGNLTLESANRTSHLSRSFFGVHHVLRSAELSVYKNGTTVHGIQSLSPDQQTRCTPRTYYHPDSPIAVALAVLRSRGPLTRVGLVGLGVGSLASYTRPGEHWTFFEIDPEVQRIAADPAKFTFLSECVASKARADVEIADGRLALAAQAKGTFDVIVVDAFSSDAIPLHLLTRQAVEIYRTRLRPGGTVLFHVSSRYYELSGLLSRLASNSKMFPLIGHEFPTDEEEEKLGRLASTWIALARDADTATLLAKAFHPLAPAPDAPLWSDDDASLLSILRPGALWRR